MLDGNSGLEKLTQGCGNGLLLCGMIYLGLALLVSEPLSDSDSDEKVDFLGRFDFRCWSLLFWYGWFCRFRVSIFTWNRVQRKYKIPL
ncbi:hypothetical protein DPMN_111770 [Dreissena polymorpha]|uniref:Uncharacterized protein n=1 Tax=Dreissena polymorpha TaxID=45954 RepID=A0A9D4KFU0_DREPO|nr:hypothetical protein DPMN_111770 [Dreissena polymorpha]